MIDNKNSEKSKTRGEKILGGDSRVERLTKLRKKLVDDLVLNSRQQPDKTKKKDS